MQIRANFQDKTLYMQLSGEMDEHSASAARRSVDRMAEEYAARLEKAIIDVSEVTFMDSTGIGFLIGRYKKLNRYRIRMYISNPNTSADKVLSVSGIYNLIEKV